MGTYAYRRAGFEMAGFGVLTAFVIALSSLPGSVAEDGSAPRSNSVAPAATSARPSALPLLFRRVATATGGSTLVTQGPGYAFSFGEDGVEMAFEGGRSLELDLVGTGPALKVRPGESAAAKANFFIGDDPARWRVNQRLFDEVVYANAWPGVDVIFHGTGAKLKYDLRVAPGADPDRVALRYKASGGTRLDARGNLVVGTGSAAFIDSAPVTWQKRAREKKLIDSRFELNGDGTFGFELGAYDRARPLVIDPGIVFKSFIGLSNQGDGWGIATGPDGSAYMTGVAYRNWPTTEGAFETEHQGGSDTFVMKIDPTGNVVYSTYLGGSNSEFSRAISVGPDGSAYVGGQTESLDYPTTPGALDDSYSSDGNPTGFVTRVDPSGSRLVYSTRVTGTYNVFGIFADDAGHAFLTGSATHDLPVTGDAFSKVHNERYTGHSYVAELDAAGSRFEYATYLGGSRDDVARDIAVVDGHIYVAGETWSRDFPVVMGSFDTSFNGQWNDVFVVKFSGDKRALDYSTYIGGSAEYQEDYGAAAFLDDGSVIVSGSTRSRDFPMKDAHDADYSGEGEGFLTRIAPDGRELLYSTYVGGGKGDNAESVTADRYGNAYVGGSTLSHNMPGVEGTPTTEVPSFLIKFMPDGRFDSGTYLWGAVIDLAADPAGSVYVSGFDPSPGRRIETARSGGNQRRAREALGRHYFGCTIVGTRKADVLVGRRGPDIICGRGGDDLIRARGGSDVVIGGNGSDRIVAGGGFDVVDGRRGADLLIGGVSRDLLRGGLGPDRLRGGSGADRLSGGPRGDRMRGGRGEDSLTGDKGSDTLDGGLQSDRCRGGAGSDIKKRCDG